MDNSSIFVPKITVVYSEDLLKLTKSLSLSLSLFLSEGTVEFLNTKPDATIHLPLLNNKRKGKEFLDYTKEYPPP